MTLSRGIHISSGTRTLVSIGEFSVAENRITLLLGESGIGKSLMAKALYGLLDPDDLTVTMDGEPYVTYLSRPETERLQEESFFVFQEPSTHLNPLMRLGSQIREGSLQSSDSEDAILRKLWQNAPDDIQKILDVYPKPYRPSGGEKQRILLAMAFKKLDMLLAKGQDLRNEMFVFDEPTGSLDNAYRDLFMDMLFERYRKMNFTCLLITHDYSMIGKINRTHRDLMGSISFKEVTLGGNGLALNEFDPELYITWLDVQRPYVPMRKESQPRTLLTVESGAQVFGRRLLITASNRSGNCVLEVKTGEIVYLKAGSGVGKTTLVKLLAGLLKAERLDARIDGMHITELTWRNFWQESIWGKVMTMVFQHADEALNPESSVSGVFSGLPGSRENSGIDLAYALGELFDADIIPALLPRKVKHLSGGQKQRLNLMRGFALDTDILILDEPLNGLDFESAGKVIALLQKKQAAGKGILLISHNEEIFDRIVRPEHVYFLHAEEIPE